MERDYVRGSYEGGYPNSTLRPTALAPAVRNPDGVQSLGEELLTCLADTLGLVRSLEIALGMVWGAVPRGADAPNAGTRDIATVRDRLSCSLTLAQGIRGVVRDLRERAAQEGLVAP